jgi:RNA polymerase sigma factor (TIGR02999 family)
MRPGPPNAAPGNLGHNAAMTEDATPRRETSRELVQLLYAELKQVASRERWKLGNAPTLQTTALISETYLKLHKVEGWNDREHFLRAAAVAMRQVLVDAARERFALKRGGGMMPDTLSAAERVAIESDDQILHVDEALARLQELEPRLAEVVECRFFAGYSEAETAQALSISDRTVRRDWLKAKAWLFTELNPS